MKTLLYLLIIKWGIMGYNFEEFERTKGADS